MSRMKSRNRAFIWGIDGSTVATLTLVCLIHSVGVVAAPPVPVNHISDLPVSTVLFSGGPAV